VNSMGRQEPGHVSEVRMSATRENRQLSAGMPLLKAVRRPTLSGNRQDEHEKRKFMSRLWHLIVAKLATASWLFVVFDTAGEVIFTEASQLANQPVERAPSVDSGLFQTSPAVSFLVTWIESEVNHRPTRPCTRVTG
jgi:hypothetical protein